MLKNAEENKPLVAVPEVVGIDFTKIPFIQAKWYQEVDDRHPRYPQLIVIHSMEAPEKPETAENVAKYFKAGAEGRKASANYCIDNNSIVQCVQCKDVAYGAANANRHGIHLEHAGYAAQLGYQWDDEYSLAMLLNSAKLCAYVLMPKFGIPPVWLSEDQVVASVKNKNIKGFCTHADVTRAWKKIDPEYSGSHLDPGPYFPKNRYMEMIRKEMEVIRTN